MSFVVLNFKMIYLVICLHFFKILFFLVVSVVKGQKLTQNDRKSLIFKQNIMEVSCVALPNLIVLCKQYFAYLVQVKNGLQKAFTIAYRQLFGRTKFFEPNKHFFRNLNHNWKCRKQKENFQTILVIIFWNFRMFWCRSDQPQVN